MNFVSLQTAKAQGLVRYFTGKPCKYGHIAERFTSTRSCCKCLAERNSLPELVEFRRDYYKRQYKEQALAIRARERAYNATERGQASIKARAARRRARKANAPGSYSLADVLRLRRLQRDKCAYCAKSLNGKGSVDHVTALARGGTNSPDNLQLLCRSCNCRKHTRDAIEFANQMGRLL